MATVFTAGTFDILHVGHINLLSACRRLAGPEGKVVVSLNSDLFIEQYKGERPINRFLDRYKHLKALRDVDLVVEHTGQDARPAIDAVNPDIVVVGTDWATRDYYKQMGFTQQWLDIKNIVLCYVPYTGGISSSKLRRHIVD